MHRAALTSIALHLALLLTALPWLPRATPSRAPADLPRIEMLPVSVLTGDRDRDNPAEPAPNMAAAASAVPMPSQGLDVPMPPAPSAREALDQAIGTAIATGIGVIPPSPDGRRNLPPRYPEEARRHGVEGRVVLVLHVAPDGHVTSVEVERGSGFAALDRAAGDAVLHWHFHPALAGTTAVESTFETEVAFQLTDKK